MTRGNERKKKISLSNDLAQLKHCEELSLHSSYFLQNRKQTFWSLTRYLLQTDEQACYHLG